jgi:gentisate 1,2-dioxygenase
MFESGIYFFGGPGHTIIQQEGKRQQRIDWKERSLFSIPLNVKYQHFNDGDKPVRLLAVTSFPFVMNSMDSAKFVFENPFAFRNRYDAEEDYGKKSVHERNNLTVTNFVPDALEFKLDSYDRRGKGTSNTHWEMSSNSMIDMHVSEMPGGLYKRAHRHSSDAFILLLSGDGYSLTWPESDYNKRVRVDWKEGSMFVPPIYWYHQHLNPGKEPARYLAINAPILVSRLGLRFEDQIEPDLPQIESEFKEEVAKRGGVEKNGDKSGKDDQ